ncbi:flagellar biosynthesis anti-sigma factor FlgM [Bacillus sp. FJAT-42376]|uniref:flagellar biosynthesis anti-sigma factor FlgM n=1 Tax=Bacillus sp. FJAT-42376 TaxID=2014076 RepID=UPI000F4E53D5|nr:flagellar biosynthesis anti-sigma factor FlgM [Bacillus sp. FJAT-42376]AZB44541.1 flagellar biosynthesis anti-sigma factor FlgM [Bacillus sp. FJAT-42376]
MKINNYGANGINPYKRNAEQVIKSEAVQKKQDKIEISSAAKELQSTNKLTEARQEKLDQLKAKIENGTYEIKPAEIARKFADFYKQ